MQIPFPQQPDGGDGLTQLPPNGRLLDAIKERIFTNPDAMHVEEEQIQCSQTVMYMIEDFRYILDMLHLGQNYVMMAGAVISFVDMRRNEQGPSSFPFWTYEQTLRERVNREHDQLMHMRDTYPESQQFWRDMELKHGIERSRILEYYLATARVVGEELQWMINAGLYFACNHNLRYEKLLLRNGPMSLLPTVRRDGHRETHTYTSYEALHPVAGLRIVPRLQFIFGHGAVVQTLGDDDRFIQRLDVNAHVQDHKYAIMGRIV